MATILRKYDKDYIALDPWERNVVILSLKQLRNRRRSILKRQALDPVVVESIKESVPRLDHLISVYEQTK